MVRMKQAGEVENEEEMVVTFDDGLVLVATQSAVGFEGAEQAGLFADYLFRLEPGAEAAEATEMNTFWGMVESMDPDNELIGSTDGSNEETHPLHAAVSSKLRQKWSHLVTETLTFVAMDNAGEVSADYTYIDVSPDTILQRLVDLGEHVDMYLGSDIFVVHYDQDIPIHVHRVFDPRRTYQIFDKLALQEQ